MTRLVIAATLGIAFAAVPEPSGARDCVANFSQEGDWNTGMTFKSLLEIQGIPRADAVERVAQEMAIVGIQGISVNKDVGIVSGHVSSAGTGKPSSMNAVVRQTSDEEIQIEIVFQLLGGLRTSPSAVRDEFCQILEAVLPDEQKAAAEAAAESSRPRLETASGSLPLKEMVGEIRKAGFGPVLMFFLDFQGGNSVARTSDQLPQIVMTTSESPQETFLLVTLDPDREDNRRSLKMGSAGRLLKLAVQGGSNLPPDKDWTLPFSVDRAEGGTWIITPSSPLPPGEYGLFEIESGSLLYDFAVDD